MVTVLTNKSGCHVRSKHNATTTLARSHRHPVHFRRLSCSMLKDEKNAAMHTTKIVSSSARQLGLHSLRGDPTRTLLLRQQYVADMTRRFKAIMKDITTSIVKNDCFGLVDDRPVIPGIPGLKFNAPIPVREFQFNTSARKVSRFMNWLQTQVDEGMLQTSIGPERTFVGAQRWNNVYIESAFKRGLERGDKELRKAKFTVPERGTGWVQASMSSPINADKVGLLFVRNFEELKGITSTMSQQIGRILAQGMADGRGPIELARQINDRVNKIGIVRARILARTEVIAAHHAGMINMYREAGVQGVTVLAEWATAGDERVCEDCESLEGRIFTLDEIDSMIPLHPQCRCVALPANVGEERLFKGDIKELEDALDRL